MTPTEQDKELDLFSEEALKIAKALRSKYPNTWRLLYDNRVMLEVIAFITADRKRVALEARIDELKKVDMLTKPLLPNSGSVETNVKAWVKDRLPQLKAQQEDK